MIRADALSVLDTAAKAGLPKNLVLGRKMRFESWRKA